MFDVTYAIRQLSIVTVLAMAPAWLFGWLRARRLLLLVIAPATVLADLWFVYQTLATSARIWDHSALPYTPLKVGPSYLSLFELGWVLVLMLWMPFAAFWIGGILWRRWRRVQPTQKRATTLRVCMYLLAATCVTSVVLGVTEYAHEDTVFASGFSLVKWRAVQTGMNRSQVHALLGSPLKGACTFAPSAECWVANFSAGHFAAVWFEDERATRVYRWYSD